MLGLIGSFLALSMYGGVFCTAPGHLDELGPFFDYLVVRFFDYLEFDCLIVCCSAYLPIFRHLIRVIAILCSQESLVMEHGLGEGSWLYSTTH